jgi:hypothetical protein
VSRIAASGQGGGGPGGGGGGGGGSGGWLGWPAGNSDADDGGTLPDAGPLDGVADALDEDADVGTVVGAGGTDDSWAAPRAPGWSCSCSRPSSPARTSTTATDPAAATARRRQ